MSTLKRIVFVCAAAWASAAFAGDDYYWCYAIVGQPPEQQWHYSRMSGERHDRALVHRDFLAQVSATSGGTMIVAECHWRNDAAFVDDHGHIWCYVKTEALLSEQHALGRAASHGAWYHSRVTVGERDDQGTAHRTFLAHVSAIDDGNVTDSGCSWHETRLKAKRDRTNIKAKMNRLGVPIVNTRWRWLGYSASGTTAALLPRGARSTSPE